MIKDSGQRFTGDEVEHLVSRMNFILRTKFKHLNFIFICDAFDRGLFGKYGGRSNITVNNLIGWIYGRIKENQELIRTKHENKNYDYPDWDENKFNSVYSEMLVFLRVQCDISPDDIDPEHDPFTSQTTSPKIKKLQNDFEMAKKNNNLVPFRIRMINEFSKSE